MARPPFCMARRRRVAIDREDVNWEAVRAEYMAGGVSQAALAKRHGVSAYALRKRAGAEGWAAAKARGSAKAGDDAGTGEGEGVGEGANAGAQALEEAGGAGPVEAGADAVDAASGKVGGAGAEAGDGEVRVARRTRMALLQMLERAAAAIPCDATEIKTTGDGGEVRLLKLRDLTAAYKELAGDLPVEDADGGSRVVIDV